MSAGPEASSPAAAEGLERLRIDRGAPGSPPRRRRRTPWGWIVVLLLGLAAAGFAVVSRMSVIEVRTAPARRESATEGAVRTTANGYVVARTRAAISSRLSGRLERLLVDVGDRVTRGQALGELGHADLDAALAQAEAEVDVRRRAADTARAQHDAASAAAKAQAARVAEMEASVREMEARVADAERVVAREEKLDAGGAGARDDLETARMQRTVMSEQLGRARAATDSMRADVARAEADAAAAGAAVESAAAALVSAEAAVRHAAALRQDAFIVAPFDGVVVRKEAEVGEMVAPVNAAGSTTRGAVVTLVDFATLEMEVDVIERDIAKVDDGAPCRIVLDARREHPYAGKVRQKVPTADRSTSTVRVKVSFDALDPFVLPEMGGRVEFLAADKARVALAKDRVLAPAEAFTDRDGKRGVWIVRDGKAEFQAAREAEGSPASGEVEVVEGLAGGEALILAPPAGLVPGAEVRVAEAPKQP